MSNITKTNYLERLSKLLLERKQAEEALLKTKAELLKSIERYTYVSMATSDAIWDWEIATDTIYRGEGFKTIFGYEPTVSTLEIRMSSIIHPDDSERVRSELEAALQGNALQLATTAIRL